MDVAIPPTPGFVFSFPCFKQRSSLFAVCTSRSRGPCAGPGLWLSESRFRLKLNTMQLGAFPKALTFFFLVSSRTLTAYLAGLTTSEFCLQVCKKFVLAGRKKGRLCKVIQPLPLVGMRLCVLTQAQTETQTRIDVSRANSLGGCGTLQDTAHALAAPPSRWWQSM